MRPANQSASIVTGRPACRTRTRNGESGVVEADRGEPVLAVEHHGEIAGGALRLLRVHRFGVDPRVAGAHLPERRLGDPQRDATRRASGVEVAVGIARTLGDHRRHGPGRAARSTRSGRGRSGSMIRPRRTRHEDEHGENRQMVTTGVIVTGGASGIGLASARALAKAGRPVALWDIDGAKAAVAASDVSEAFGVATIGLGIDVRDTADFPEAIEPQPRRARLDRRPGPRRRRHRCRHDRRRRDRDLGRDDRASTSPPVRCCIRDVSADLIANPGSAVVADLLDRGHRVARGDPGVLLGQGRAARPRPLLRRPPRRPGRARQRRLPRVHRDADARPGDVGPGALEAYGQRIPLGRLGVPEEIGNVVRFLLSEEASYINCAEIVVDGGVSKTTF